MNEFRQGAGPQADQERAPGPALELFARVAQEQAGHHDLRVLQHQCMRAADAHGALNPIGAEVQIADSCAFADFNRVHAQCSWVG